MLGLKVYHVGKAEGKSVTIDLKDLKEKKVYFYGSWTGRDIKFLASLMTKAYNELKRLKRRDSDGQSGQQSGS